MEVLRAGELYEYAVLVTALEEDVLGVAQLYRDRADAENIFDELKNQWGWAGFTTQDHQRCQMMARLVALIYNWWSLFTRLAIQPADGGDHQPAAVAARDRPPDHPRQPDHADHHQQPCAGRAGTPGLGSRKPGIAATCANCGAV